jgi:biotin transport system substrate-specific component
MVACALFAAIICILAPLSVQIGPVPISLGVFAVAFTAVVLGAKKGSIATALYILIGAVGLPVFASYKAGISVIIGMTGGYVWSYIIMAFVIGAGSYFKSEKKLVKIAAIVLSIIIAILVCYTMGTAQFMLVSGQNLATSLSVCVIPFIPFDIAKLVVAFVLGTAVKEGLKKAKLI